MIGSQFPAHCAKSLLYQTSTMVEVKRKMGHIPEMHKQDLISIGALAARVGLSVSAVRFYEAKGLLTPLRNAGGQRRFFRADIRRTSFILIAQRLGLSIAEIGNELARLPAERTPNAADWRAISTALRARIDQQIAELERVRDTLDGCIGCGCLSLERCALYNHNDKAASRGTGPRYWLGDRAKDIPEASGAGR